MRTLLSVILIVAGSSSCGRTHTLRDGAYAFQLDRVIKDECNLAQVPEVMSGGTLRTTGHVVSFDYGLFDIQLVGNYLDSTERMSLDGSAANVNTRVNDVECLLDTVTVHVDDTEQDASHFTGNMSINFDARRPESCVCELWVSYSAELTLATPQGF